MREAARIAGRQHQHRYRVAVGLRHAAVGVFGAGAVLHAERAHFLAARQARYGIRHVQADSLLADDDGPDIRDRGCLQQLVARVSEQDIDALPLQDLRDCGSSFHSSTLREFSLDGNDLWNVDYGPPTLRLLGSHSGQRIFTGPEKMSPRCVAPLAATPVAHDAAIVTV